MNSRTTKTIPRKLAAGAPAARSSGCPPSVAALIGVDRKAGVWKAPSCASGRQRATSSRGCRSRTPRSRRAGCARRSGRRWSGRATSICPVGEPLIGHDPAEVAAARAPRRRRRRRPRASIENGCFQSAASTPGGGTLSRLSVMATALIARSSSDDDDGDPGDGLAVEVADRDRRQGAIEQRQRISTIVEAMKSGLRDPVAVLAAARRSRRSGTAGRGRAIRPTPPSRHARRRRVRARASASSSAGRPTCSMKIASRLGSATSKRVTAPPRSSDRRAGSTRGSTPGSELELGVAGVRPRRAATPAQPGQPGRATVAVDARGGPSAGRSRA